MKKTFLLLSFLVCMVSAVQAQVYNQMDPSGNITQRDEYGNNSSFNPNRRDTTHQNKEVPIGLRFWKIDRRFGDVIPSQPDTVPHLYQNSIYATGLYGQYNTLGNNYTSRINRIFIDRPETSQFYFTQPYSFTTKQPDDFLFVNTLSPYTHITYETCGDKQNGEDHIDAKFAVNAGKRVGMGFDLDYHYATGYYANQNNSHFRATLFGSYIGDQYQMHTLLTFHHRKATESGGIVNDEYITHPEAQESSFNEDEIPTVLKSNWNRNNSQHFFLSHRYNIGFYRKVKMTDAEIKAKQFAQKSAQQKREREERKTDQPMESGRKGAKVKDTQPAGRPDGAVIMGDAPETGKKPVLADSARIKVQSQAQLDSLKHAKEAEDYNISALFQKEDVLTTFVTNTIRSTRFGAADPTGVANIFVYNYLLESKSIIWNPSGRYSIDYDKTWQALETLGAEILRIQAQGDFEAAKTCIDKYGIAGPESLSDKRVLENAGIPVDIRFNYE